MIADSIALQSREGGVRAALLLRLAAEVLLHRGPAKEPVLEA